MELGESRKMIGSSSASEDKEGSLFLWFMEQEQVTDVPKEEDNTEHLGQGMTITFVFIVITLDCIAIMGNGLVIIAFVQDRQVREPKNYYIFNLAVTDFVSAVFSVPFYTTTITQGYWLFGHVFCSIWMTVNLMARLEAAYTIVLITHDRYLLVKDPLRYQTNSGRAKKALVEIGFSWVVTFLLRFPFIVFSHWWVSDQGLESSCSPNSKLDAPFRIGLPVYDLTYTLLSVLCEYVVPLACIIYWNIYVYRKIRQQSRKVVSELIVLSCPCVPPNAPPRSVRRFGFTQRVFPAARADCNWKLESCEEKTPKESLLSCRKSSCNHNQQEDKQLSDGTRGEESSIKKDHSPSLVKKRVQACFTSASRKYTVQNESLEMASATSGFSCTSLGRKLSLQEQTRELRYSLEQQNHNTVLDRQTPPLTAAQHCTNHVSLLLSKSFHDQNVSTGGKTAQDSVKGSSDKDIQKERSQHDKTAKEGPESNILSTEVETNILALHAVTRECPPSAAGHVQPKRPSPNKSSNSRVSSDLETEQVDTMTIYAIITPGVRALQKPDEGDDCSNPVETHVSKAEHQVDAETGADQTHHVDTHAPGTSPRVSLDEPRLHQNWANKTSAVDQQSRKNVKRAAVILFVITIMFIVCRTPYVVARLSAVFCQDCIQEAWYEAMYWLGWALTLINPFLYAFISSAFRNYCIRLLKKLKGKICRHDKQSL